MKTNRRVVVVHPGAGIAAAAYRRFAGFLAEAGIPVLTYDYRGIGASRPKALRGFRAAIEDWAEYDCGGAIAWPLTDGRTVTRPTVRAIPASRWRDASSSHPETTPAWRCTAAQPGSSAPFRTPSPG